jgi:hypothetical protein
VRSLGRLAIALFALTARSASAQSLAPATDVEYRSVSVGPILDFGYGSSAVGQSLLGDLGGQYLGIQSFRGRRLLVQWDASLAARGGILGNTLPYTPLAGVHTAAMAEAGYRWQPTRALSLYTGGRLDGELAILTRPGTALSDLDRLNDMAGVGGVVARLAPRADIGLSLLRGLHSVLLVAFFQESLRAPWGHTPGAAFAEGGVMARYDLSRTLTAILEALGGAAPKSSTPALDTTDQTAHVEVSALVRGIFRNGMWLAVSGGFGRDFDHRVYQASGRAYDTANAPSFSVALAYGVEVDPQRRKGRGP